MADLGGGSVHSDGSATAKRVGGRFAYHVMNRVAGRQDLFEDAGDYEAFERVRDCVCRGWPYGDRARVSRTAARLGLETTLRPVGRPKKTQQA